MWDQPSSLEGWTYKDLLAHLAASVRYLRSFVKAVIEEERVSLEIFSEVDEYNHRDVEERKDTSVEDLTEELERAGEEMQTLLTRLSSKHERLRFADDSLSVGEFLGRSPGGHDLVHLAQLRTALEK
jgi:hypothetical protein